MHSGQEREGTECTKQCCFRYPSWPDGHITNHLSSLIIQCSVLPLWRLDSHKNVPWVGGFTSKLALCCLLAGRKRVDGDKPEAMMRHSSCPRGYGMFTGRPPSNAFPWSQTLRSHHYSPQLDSYLVKVSLSLFTTSCCQTVYIGQICSLSPACSLDLGKKGFGKIHTYNKGSGETSSTTINK